MTLSRSRSSAAPKTILLSAVLCLSGFAGLGYQAVWTRLLALGLGHEYVAVLGVVSAFFFGIAIGSWCFDRRVSSSQRPGLWFAGFEAVIGIWALALIVLLPKLNAVIPHILGVDASAVMHWGVAFLAPLIILGPATIAMGGTLPAADRFMGQLRTKGFALGGVYGSNTFGAVLGILGLTFWIAPQLGYSQALVVLALMNLLCAAVLILLQKSVEPLRDHTFAETLSRSAVLTLAATGFLGIGYEIVAIRALSQILENTVFSFAAVLAVYLLGTAFGAGLYQASQRLKRVSTIQWLQLQALAALSGVAGLWLAPWLYNAPASPITGELLAGAAVFLVPTLFMGMIFTHLVERLRLKQRGVGLALAANTLGAACAPFVFGVAIMPWLGAVNALVVISLCYVLLRLPQSRLTFGGMAAACGCGAALAFTSLSPTLLQLPEGATAQRSIEGVMGTVNVYKDAAGFTHLKINNGYVMGGTGSFVPDRRQGHIPLLLHPNPQKALFLGLGTGATFAAAAYHPGLDAQAVELVPEILDVLSDFDAVSGEIGAVEQLRTISADARRFVTSTQSDYNVIVADTFHPSRDGAGLLYTAEHFSAIQQRLAPGGLFCQWLPLHQLDVPTLKIIIRTFVSVYPNAIATLNDLSLETPVLGLIGGFEGFRPNREILQDQILQAALAKAELNAGFGPLDGIVAGPASLKAFAGEGTLNTDDHPHVIFQAPKAVYDGLGDHGARLVSILQELQPLPASTLLGGRAAERLENYWTARDAFLMLGTTRNPDLSADDVIAQLGQPLLEIVSKSPEFRPAYEPLLEMAGYLVKNDPPRSLQLLQALALANPKRQEAAMLIERWFPGAQVARP